MKNYLLFIPICIGLAIFFYPTTSNSYANGSPGAKTNSPMDGQNCTACHSGTINSGIGNIEITTNIPTAGYSIGNTYTITLTGIQASCTKFGFELTAEATNNSNKAGTFFITNSTETKFATGTNSTAVTHKTAGNSGNNTKSWSMDWTAGPTMFGSTTFYAALMFANNNGNNNGDNVFTTTLMFEEEIISNINDLLESNNFTFNTASKTIDAQKTVYIYDVNGKLVLTTTKKSTNIAYLKNGIYILKSFEQSQKIILN